MNKTKNKDKEIKELYLELHKIYKQQDYYHYTHKKYEELQEIADEIELAIQDLENSQ